MATRVADEEALAERTTPSVPVGPTLRVMSTSSSLGRGDALKSLLRYQAHGAADSRLIEVLSAPGPSGREFAVFRLPRP